MQENKEKYTLYEFISPENNIEKEEVVNSILIPIKNEKGAVLGIMEVSLSFLAYEMINNTFIR